MLSQSNPGLLTVGLLQYGLHGATLEDYLEFQLVQNAAVQRFLGETKMAHIMLLFRKQHQVLVCFQLPLVITFKTLRAIGLEYLRNWLTPGIGPGYPRNWFISIGISPPHLRWQKKQAVDLPFS